MLLGKSHGTRFSSPKKSTSSYHPLFLFIVIALTFCLVNTSCDSLDVQPECIKGKLIIFNTDHEKNKNFLYDFF